MDDDVINREKFFTHRWSVWTMCQEYKIAEMNYLLENKASRLGVRSSDPGALEREWMRISFQLLQSYGTRDEADAHRNSIQQG